MVFQQDGLRPSEYEYVEGYIDFFAWSVQPFINK